ncbi:Oxygen sensor histidine kinase NreB [Nocardioides aquaticus]|uniref:histidine kinase n=1 Tax=Nocardioides aquaticus TaxID=160826 RepID=A0ABX8EPB3_9ACTN|nr:histidine kinase [Nocardioides aquaticus]QVT81068.1 Oxygen sensor histidine kinase NreB [Nocardioides aquaticus]
MAPDRPEQQLQPPLTAWGQAWRLVLCVAISAMAWTPYAEAQWDTRPGLFWLDGLVGVAALVAVLWRRRWPLPVALALNAATVVSGAAAGPATLALVSLATRRRALPVAAVAVVAFAGGMVYIQTTPSTEAREPWLDATVTVIALVATVVLGLYLGARRELLWTLRQRAERAEAEQELRATRARENERARIAREMHDVLAHRISQISMHAGALAYRSDLGPDQLRGQAEVIQSAANEALADLRGVLGVLRDSETGVPLERPQPTWDDLRDLVAEARAAGQHVEVVDRVDDAHPVPDPVARTVYRIVQEGLTNAGRHAPGALLTVDLAGCPAEGMTVRLRNPRGFGQRDTSGAGLGLVGLSERAVLRGGWLESGTSGRDFELHAWLPWAAA